MKRPRTNPVPTGMVYECVIASCGVCGDWHTCERHTAPEGRAEVLALGWRHSDEYGLVCADCHAAAEALTTRRRAYGRAMKEAAG